MKDRSLGSEWKEWNGKVENNSDATIGLFLLFSFGVMVIFSLILFFGNYLVYPRLESLHPIFPVLLQTFILGFIGIMVLSIGLLILSMFLKINLFEAFEKKVFSVLGLFPHTVKLAKRFGISRDRLGNSFVKLNNNLVRLRKHKFGTCDMLVLLPRCLSPEHHKKIKDVTSKYNLKTFTLAGGEAARQKIKENRPKAIIAVACERDLIAGIKDVPKNIMVYGLPNMRPNGPCKNTIIDLIEFEKSIKMFMGV